MTTYYDYDIGNEIAKVRVLRIDHKAAVGCRGAQLKPREVHILTKGPNVVRQWLRARFRAAVLDERLAHG